MKIAFLFAFLMTVTASSSALASEVPAPGQAQAWLTNLLHRPSPSDCYLECKPTSAGGDGDGFTKCYNECMNRR